MDGQISLVTLTTFLIVLTNVPVVLAGMSTVFPLPPPKVENRTDCSDWTSPQWLVFTTFRYCEYLHIQKYSVCSMLVFACLQASSLHVEATYWDEGNNRSFVYSIYISHTVHRARRLSKEGNLWRPVWQFDWTFVMRFLYSWDFEKGMLETEGQQWGAIPSLYFI